jgi:diguanylate cyclase (GGDEF)-like protein
MTRVILLIMTGLMLFFTIIVCIGWLVGYFLLVDFAITLGVQVAFTAGLSLSQRGSWRLARYIPPFVFFSLGVYGSLNAGLLTTFVLAYTTTVVLSSMLLSSQFTWTVAGIAIVTHLVLGQISYPTSRIEFLTIAIPYTSLMIGLTSLFLFAMQRLQTALSNTRDYAGRLIFEVQVREKAQAELLMRNRELSLLNRVIAASASSLEINEILSTTLTELVESLGMDRGGAALLDRDHTHLTVVAETPEGTPQSALGVQIPIDGNYSSQYVIENRKPLAIADAQHDPRLEKVDELLRERKIASILILPLIVHGQVLGTIGLDSFKQREFSQEEITLAWHAAIASAQAIENAQLYAKVQRMAIHDELTDLLNRRGLIEFGQREFERARRFQRGLSAIFMDLDNFKDINDCYGHSGGDIFLRKLAKALKEVVREVDLIGRYGGDEFVVILTETSLATALEVAERLRRRVQTTQIAIGSEIASTSTSIGVAELTPETSDLAELIARADQALYQAKRSGGNRIDVASL